VQTSFIGFQQHSSTFDPSSAPEAIAFNPNYVQYIHAALLEALGTVKLGGVTEGF
jgi:hypothetical protein